MKLLAVLIALALPMAAQVKITAGADKIAIRIDGELFTEFHIAGADLTKPYLWPLRAASGTYVTRMWPMADVPEEAGTTMDHRHQRGLWFAHEGVNGFDFWNNEASYTTPNRGRIVFRKLGTIRGGKDSGSLAATFEWVDPDGGALLRKDRTMTSTLLSRRSATSHSMTKRTGCSVSACGRLCRKIPAPATSRMLMAA